MSLMWFAFPEGVYVVCTRRLYGFRIQILLTAVNNGVKGVVQMETTIPVALGQRR